MNEATARIKINQLLEAAGWRFFADANGPANIRLEPGVDLKPAELEGLGADFEQAGRGFVDFLLLDDRGFPLLALEAKSEDKEPLVGKEQARTYARSLNCRFVILSNGNLHYFWDLERGDPHIITAFPTPDSVGSYQQVAPNPQRLVAEPVNADYIVLTQRFNYAAEAAWLNEAERPAFIRDNGLRFLRPYQERAVHALQRAVAEGKDRFLFEMATGTGKTLVSAAVIKLLLSTQNARRVLFLVDRIELENQAAKVFRDLLHNDFSTVIYKDQRENWRNYEIVVTTVQSLLFDNKYQGLFSPTDFDLVISDEAHRSISGNARAVFDYFVGYKLGLTATPRDYLNNLPAGGGADPREVEKRLWRDTYRTFGCESGEPTFRYSLLDGVNDDVLVNPKVVDARTELTTKLLSENGFTVAFIDEDTGYAHADSFAGTDFEKRFFSEATNRVFVQTFLENALTDPVTGEIGKSVIFAVSQNHAARLTNVLNEMAGQMFPDKYQSDFAVQVTSQVRDAQQFTINFANNNLMGRSNFNPDYPTSKARVCVTVGMMTTGYDCPDLLNLGLFRPIFSPTEFIQIKGRGTRRHNFTNLLRDESLKADLTAAGLGEKQAFKLFDFFAVCEYFETEFDYDEVLALPATRGEDGGGGEEIDKTFGLGSYVHLGPDNLETIQERSVGAEGMRVDRMFFDRFAHTVRQDDFVVQEIEKGLWDNVVDYVNREILNRPEEYYTLDKLRRAAEVDRRLTIREILERVFDLIPKFKSKDELLEEEFAKLVADYRPEQAEAIPVMRAFFKIYATSGTFRDTIDTGDFTALADNPAFSLDDLRRLAPADRKRITEYIKDYVSLNQFAA